ncbi:MAG: transposase [Polyangiales bacterium]
MTDVNSEIDTRRARAAVIAAAGGISMLGDAWLVPSQSRGARYCVSRDVDDDGVPRWKCTCDDFGDRGHVHPCKHVFAVELFCLRSSDAPTTAPVAPVCKRKYPRDWAAYNFAQTHEKGRVLSLLRELTLAVPELPRASRRGRPRIPIADILMAAAMKVYVGWGGRRSMEDLERLEDDGLLGRVPAYNSTSHYLEDAALTPILGQLVKQSAMPLAILGTATDFAVDSTGVGLRTFAPGYRAEKYGSPTPRQHGWVKLHACVDTRTHIFTAVVMRHGTSGDAPELIPLVNETIDSGFHIERLSADKAYCSHRNVEHLSNLDIEPFIPFPAGRGEGADAPETYRRAYHFFQFHGEEFLSRYGKRQNVEATFSAMKRVIADRVRSRTPISQINEALVIALVHNVRRLAHVMHEMGFDRETLKKAS